MAARIEDYALLGDGQAAALVAKDGSIDWLCWPIFESAPCFAALVGDASNGYWRIAPAEPVLKITRRYVATSLVLETTMHTASGVIELTDWLAWRETPARLLRRVRCISGRVRLVSELSIRFDYGRTRPWLRALDARISAVSGAHALWFDGPSRPECDDGVLRHECELQAGDRRDFALTCSRSYDAPPVAPDVQDMLDATLHHWTHWSSRLALDGVGYAEPIGRSLSVLRGLMDWQTGGIAAAATSSLPERIGGALNWDYRYCWLRDASFTMLALAGTGLRAEATAWRDWLLRALAGDPAHTQTVYTTRGDSHIDEWECEWLSGYERSRPVRFGNAAVKQSQHDIYGEIIDALYVSRCHGMPPDDDVWMLERELIEHVRRIWKTPDNGLWESRGEPKHHTLSKVMSWLALDRGIKSAMRFGNDAPIDEWQREADAIRQSVLTHGFHRGVNAFVQCYGNDKLDASLLLLPMRGFLPADDPRVVATVDAIERHLMHDGLVFRYLDEDGRRPEGAFIACSCWLAQVRWMQGRKDEAKALFDRVLALQNDLGLLAEEFDADAKRQCGNFPQVLSHVAVVNTACFFDDAEHSLHAL